MKKIVEKVIIGISAFVIFSGIVYAASSTFYNDNNYNLNKGGVTIITGKAKYKVARAIMDIEKITDGDNKTKFSVNVKENGTSVEKASKIVSIAAWTCNNIKIGNVGKGGWIVTNSALFNGEKKAGWSGKLKYISES